MPEKPLGHRPDSQDGAHGRCRASACRRHSLSLAGLLGLRDAIKRRAQVTIAGTRPRHGPRLARAKARLAGESVFAVASASPIAERPADLRPTACASTRTEFRTRGPIREPCDGREPTPGVVPMDAADVAIYDKRKCPGRPSTFWRTTSAGRCTLALPGTFVGASGSTSRVWCSSRASTTSKDSCTMSFTNAFPMRCKGKGSSNAGEGPGRLR